MESCLKQIVQKMVKIIQEGSWRYEVKPEHYPLLATRYSLLQQFYIVIGKQTIFLLEAFCKIGRACKS